MNDYKIKITFTSNVLIGSGEGYGTIIDTDSIFDDIGLPFIPSKRIKGVLLESAQMLNEIFKNFNYAISIGDIFGIPGEKEGNLNIDNLYLNHYEEIYQWLNYLKSRYTFINKQRISNQMSSQRISTSIDERTLLTKEHSLRKERVIDKGLLFIGDIDFDEKYEKDMAVICQNVRRLGTKRNRGLGEVKVELLKGFNKLFDTKILKEVLK